MLQLTALLVTLIIPSLASSHLIVHERREELLEDVVNRQRIEPDALLPMRIGLRQSDFAALNAERWLMKVADPDSANFGRHWSQSDVIEAFQPPDESLKAVQKWLTDHGVAGVTHTGNRQWLAVDMRADQVEALLNTEYFEHFNDRTGRFEASCDQYSIPEHLSKHVDFIMPAVQGKDVTGRTRRSLQYIEQRLHDEHNMETLQARQPVEQSLPSSTNDLSRCAESVSPACIRHLYGLPTPNLEEQISSNNALGVFEEYTITLQADMNKFFHRYTEIPNDTSSIYHSIDGAVTRLAQVKSYRKQFLKDVNIGIALGESTLDLQCAFPIVYPQNITVFEVNDPYWSKYQFASDHSHIGLFNPFFDAIDGSDCKFVAYGQDDSNPKLDPVYPDPREHGYRGKLQCGVFKPTNVLSISYGLYELAISPNYQKRQCLEFLKLALQGVSVFVSSGDLGTGPCTRPPKTGIFNANDPAGCPWLTTVGATTIAENRTVYEPEIAAPFSGGGFSNYFSRPAYQAEAVRNYFEHHDPGIPYYTDGRFRSGKGRYNRDGRAYPDIAANGVSIATIIHGSHLPASGTSASAPIVAAIFNRIVEERIRRGKGPLGLVNPTLYKNPSALNDITIGNNHPPYDYAQACTQGFTCVPGWEPVCGLGTPNYPKLLDVFLNLP